MKPMQNLQRWRFTVDQCIGIGNEQYVAFAQWFLVRLIDDLTVLRQQGIDAIRNACDDLIRIQARKRLRPWPGA